MRSLFMFFTCLILMIMSQDVLAVEMQSIYKASIPVTSQSDENKNIALQKGLEQVLIGVSGNEHILDNPKLKTSLAHAEDLAEEFSYAPSPPESAKTTPYLLVVRFDQEQVDKLLRDAGTSMWGQNRPLILVWLAYEGPNHPVDIVDSSGNTIESSLLDSAKKRGLPLIFPVMDVTELGQISATNIINKNLDQLKQASQRYASNAILIGHVTATATGASSQWQLMLGADQWSWNITGKDAAEVFTGLANNISDTLAGRYSTVVTNAVQSHITLKVVGLNQQADISQLMKYLQQLTPVAGVQLQSVAGDAILLDVNLRSSPQAFVQAASLGTNLQPITGDSVDGVLQYKWTQ